MKTLRLTKKGLVPLLMYLSVNLAACSGGSGCSSCQSGGGVINEIKDAQMIAPKMIYSQFQQQGYGYVVLTNTGTSALNNVTYGLDNQVGSGD